MALKCPQLASLFTLKQALKNGDMDWICRDEYCLFLPLVESDHRPLATASTLCFSSILPIFYPSTLHQPLPFPPLLLTTRHSPLITAFTGHRPQATGHRFYPLLFFHPSNLLPFHSPPTTAFPTAFTGHRPQATGHRFYPLLFLSLSRNSQNPCYTQPPHAPHSATAPSGSVYSAATCSREAPSASHNSSPPGSNPPSTAFASCVVRSDAFPRHT